MGSGTIALGDNLAPLPWHLRVNLDVEDHFSTGVLIHPRQREGLRVLERCYEEHIIISVACRGDTKDANRRHRTKVLVDRPMYSSNDYICRGYIIQYNIPLNSVTCTNSRVESCLIILSWLSIIYIQQYVREIRNGL